MTSRVDAWTTSIFPLGTWLDDHDQAVDTALLISDKTTSITVVRGASTLSAQTVRIEQAGGNRQVQTSAGEVAIVDAIILGYKGHPTIADTNLQVGDRFAVAGLMYEIIGLVVSLPDSLQAYARVLS